ncbi:YopX family protein [Lacticaseibacillus suibinensis]|uniref:YopX family protein n=1 Tax=Lacticaseibacillus suibinensis TaxID=2486011 RepID=UPI000F7B2F68|nr:YopX family protein [Lacticaseibacillus suibinensis]
MRQIKFREWDPEREKMYGKGHGMSYSDRLESDNATMFVFDHEESDDNREEEKDMNGVPFRRIMQYTGLHDKNGREIYEGDIVRSKPRRQHEKSFVGAVHYGRVDPSFTIHDKDGHDFRLYYSGEYRTYEVIGNIFEDKQLLEVAEHDED